MNGKSRCFHFLQFIPQQSQRIQFLFLFRFPRPIQFPPGHFFQVVPTPAKFSGLPPDDSPGFVSSFWSIARFFAVTS